MQYMWNKFCETFYKIWFFFSRIRIKPFYFNLFIKGRMYSIFFIVKILLTYDEIVKRPYLESGTQIISIYEKLIISK